MAIAGLVLAAYASYDIDRVLNVCADTRDAAQPFVRLIKRKIIDFLIVEEEEKKSSQPIDF